MKGLFVVRHKDKILEFSDYESIPEVFDYVIRFEPTPPEPPHTEEEHAEINSYNKKLQELVKREKRCRQ